MKKIFILICVAALLFALCACTDQKQEETVTTAKQATGTTAAPSGTGEDTSEQTTMPEDDDSEGWSKLY